MKKTLSIIIPVFNEERTIKEILIRVANVKLPNNIAKEVIVVDDCSKDKTSQILLGVKSIKFKYIKHDKNLGKGAAVRTGFLEARGDYIIIQDTDLEYDPNDYVKLLSPIIKNKSKIVFGTRLKNYPLRFWGEKKTLLPLHLIANKFLTGLVNLLFGANLTDMETGYKLFNKNILDRIQLKSDRFEIEPEITAKILKLGYDIVEVPIEVLPRSYKEGKKIGFMDFLKAIWAIFWYRFFD